MDDADSHRLLSLIKQTAMTTLKVIVIFLCFSFVTVVSLTRPLSSVNFTITVADLYKTLNDASDTTLRRVANEIVEALHKLPDEEKFIKEASSIAQELDMPVHNLFVKFYIESGIDPSRQNKGTKATGIYQLMKFNMRDGMTPEKFKKLSATQQLKYYREYIIPYKKYLKGKGAVELYVANLCPKALVKGHYVLYKKDRDVQEYKGNQVLDIRVARTGKPGKDGIIDRGDIQAVVNRYLIE